MFTLMKLAHLILTHANPQQVKKLIGKLAHENADFYIHVDKKTPIESFLELGQLPNVTFIQNRVKVYWGGYSIVQATINGFEEILNSGKKYDYINLASGQDYPIKKTADIHNFLAKNQGKIFMHYLSLTDEWQEAIPRITQYHLINYNLPAGTYIIEQFINSILPKRKLPANMVAMGRSQWFTASPESIAYALNYIKEKSWVSRFFKLTWAPDEIIFQTILYNSQFKEKMVNNNLVYLDWSQGKASPKLLTMEDAAALQTSDKLFARKLANPASDQLIDYLDEITA